MGWGDTGVSISGATTLSYVPVSGDIGHTLEIKVTATNSAGSTSATSLSTSSITGVTSMAKTINYQCASSGNAGLGAYTGMDNLVLSGIIQLILRYLQSLILMERQRQEFPSLS